MLRASKIVPFKLEFKSTQCTRNLSIFSTCFISIWYLSDHVEQIHGHSHTVSFRVVTCIFLECERKPNYERNPSQTPGEKCKLLTLDFSYLTPLFFTACLVLPGKCVKFHKRPVPPTAPDSSSFHRHATNNRRNGGVAAPSHKPLRERIIHLLALKAYRKPELLLWLERERAGPKDKADLGAILEEVGTEKRRVCISMHACINSHMHGCE